MISGVSVWFWRFCILALMLCHGIRSVAAELGFAAPPLAIAQWVKGEKVVLSEGKGKNVFVLVFWEANCSHCRDNFQRLSELQATFKNKGLIVIAISADPADTVKQVVDKMDRQMDFRTGVDDQLQTYGRYMTAFDRKVVPCAFVIDRQGSLVWFGHPAAGLDKALEEIFAGKFDLAASKKVANAEALLPRYFLAVKGGPNESEGETLGTEILKDGAANPWLLNNFAYQILTDPGITNRDTKLALKAAKRACDISDNKDPAFIDTLARALFDGGKIKEAIAQQKRAIALIAAGPDRVPFEKTLQNYEQAVGKSPR
jgi:peroxiredoxin